MCVCRFPCSPRSCFSMRWLGPSVLDTSALVCDCPTIFCFTLFFFIFPYHVVASLPSAARDVAEERGRMTTRTTSDDTAAPKVHRAKRQKSTESKSAYKTTEFVVYVLAVLGVLIASMIVDQSFGADPAWRYVTYLTVGYMISRGLAKAGSREPYRD